MRLEVKHSRVLLCGHILSPEFILVGQRWASADGSNREVTVSNVDGDWIEYTWSDGDGAAVYHAKLSFAFQCRYCLIVDVVKEQSDGT